MIKSLVLMGLVIATSAATYAQDINYSCFMLYTFDGWKTIHEVKDIKLTLNESGHVSILKTPEGAEIDAKWEKVNCSSEGDHPLIGYALSLRHMKDKVYNMSSYVVRDSSDFTELSLTMNTDQSFALNCHKE